jgi:nucleotide-binding universal stress UspA family protein
MERILVLTDFSDIATKGLEAAVRLARQQGGAEIILLNTERSTSGREFSASGDVMQHLNNEDDRFMIELIRHNKDRLRKQAAAFETEGIAIQPYIEIGDMQTIVDHFLKSHKVELVVMGTSGQNTMEEYFVGNHTEQVVRVSNVPVLSVKANDHNLDFRNIVLATDMNRKADRSVEHIKLLAKKLQAKLHLVHVTGSKLEKAQAELEEYARNHAFENYTVSVIGDKDTEDGIKKYAAKVGADMIAVITHGRDGLSALLSHSVSEDVIREASVPVLTLNMKEIK